MKPLKDNVAEYYGNFPEEIQLLLHQMREVIQNNAPEAEETINYGIPTFKLNGNLVHYAAFKSHIGFYPGSEAIANFEDRLTSYKCSKGTIQFPFSGPIPFDLVADIVQHRVKAQSNKAKR